MKLIETVNLMCSNNWEDRLAAEYDQLVIRMNDLEESLNNPPQFMNDEIAKALLMRQFDAMQLYKLCLEKRAYIAGVSLK